MFVVTLCANTEFVDGRRAGPPAGSALVADEDVVGDLLVAAAVGRHDRDVEVVEVVAADDGVALSRRAGASPSARADLVDAGELVVEDLDAVGADLDAVGVAAGADTEFLIVTPDGFEPALLSDLDPALVAGAAAADVDVRVRVAVEHDVGVAAPPARITAWPVKSSSRR